MITDADVADLVEGDEVELTWTNEGVDHIVRGPLRKTSSGALFLAFHGVRDSRGHFFSSSSNRTLRVIKRVPRPITEEEEEATLKLVMHKLLTGGRRTEFWGDSRTPRVFTFEPVNVDARTAEIIQNYTNKELKKQLDDVRRLGRWEP